MSLPEDVLCLKRRKKAVKRDLVVVRKKRALIHEDIKELRRRMELKRKNREEAEKLWQHVKAVKTEKKQRKSLLRRIFDWIFRR